MTDAASSRSALLVEFIQRRFLSLVFVSIFGFVVLSFVGIGVPEWVQLAGAAMVLTAPIGYLAFGQIRPHLPTPPMAWVVDVDVLDDNGAGIYRFFVEDFHDLDVSSGSLWNPAPSLYFGKELDLDAMTVEGTWRGSLSDGEIIRALSLVKKVRGDLENRAKRGERIRNNAFTLIRGAAQGEVERIVETFEQGTLPSGGEEFESQIDDALSDFDLDELASDGLDLDRDDPRPGDDHADGPADPDRPGVDAGADDLDREAPADD